MSIPDEKEEKSVTEEIDFIHAEGGWGWIVVLATGYCFGCLMGMINNYALIYNEFDKVYNGTPNHIFYAGNTHRLINSDFLILMAIFIVSMDWQREHRHSVFVVHTGLNVDGHIRR